MKNKASEIKSYLLNQAEMDLAGIASAESLADEPEGYRPADILPGAKSIVVFGFRMADGSVQAAFRFFENGNVPARSIYSAHGTNLAPKALMLFHTFELARFIERKFECAAAPLPCGPMQAGAPQSVPIPAFVQPYTVELPFNIDRAAVAAGLGDYGYSGRILTPEFGPRVHFGAVITTLDLDYDRPYDGTPLCGGSDCFACVEHCPNEAILKSEGQEKILRGVGNIYREVADVRLNRCIVAACALRKEFGGADNYVETNNPDERELTLAFEKMPVNHWEGLDHYPKWKCDKCLIYCPVGKWKQRFSDNGLTRY